MFKVVGDKNIISRLQDFSEVPPSPHYKVDCVNLEVLNVAPKFSDVEYFVLVDNAKINDVMSQHPLGYSIDMYHKKGFFVIHFVAVA